MRIRSIFFKGTVNNIIRYGDRGTGKSSVIKALLNKYAINGIRLIELAKSDIGDIPQVMRLLSKSPKKYIIFIDDRQFEENEVPLPHSPNQREFLNIVDGLVKQRKLCCDMNKMYNQLCVGKCGIMLFPAEQLNNLLIIISLRYHGNG